MTQKLIVFIHVLFECERATSLGWCLMYVWFGDCTVYTVQLGARILM